MDETVAKPLIGKLISGHENKGPVVEADIYEADYAPGFDIWVGFENGSREQISMAQYD